MLEVMQSNFKTHCVPVVLFGSLPNIMDVF